MSTTDLTVSTGLVFTDARRHDLPDPIDIHIGRSNPDPVVIHLDTLADLAQWAQWAEATITTTEPKHHVAERWSVIHQAKGSIAELPVVLVAVELGVMTEPERYTCARCGASFGTTGGFLGYGTPADDSHEIAVARHQSGDCAPALAVTR